MGGNPKIQIPKSKSSPGGRLADSPAVHCRERIPKKSVPKGGLNLRACLKNGARFVQDQPQPVKHAEALENSEGLRLVEDDTAEVTML
jgi:hypothetical protein